METEQTHRRKGAVLLTLGGDEDSEQFFPFSRKSYALMPKSSSKISPLYDCTQLLKSTLPQNIHSCDFISFSPQPGELEQLSLLPLEKTVCTAMHCVLPKVTSQKDSGKAWINTYISCLPDLCVFFH